VVHIDTGDPPVHWPGPCLRRADSPEWTASSGKAADGQDECRAQP
jgi:hypothetical protein